MIPGLAHGLVNLFEGLKQQRRVIYDNILNLAKTQYPRRMSISTTKLKC